MIADTEVAWVRSVVYGRGVVGGGGMGGATCHAAVGGGLKDEVVQFLGKFRAVGSVRGRVWGEETGLC